MIPGAAMAPPVHDEQSILIVPAAARITPPPPPEPSKPVVEEAKPPSSRPPLVGLSRRSTKLPPLTAKIDPKPAAIAPAEPPARPIAPVVPPAPVAPASVPVAPAGPTSPYPFLGPPQKSNEIGRLGPYRVFELLGEGGMGCVFLAEDQYLQRKVALKVMKPGIIENDAAYQLFLSEARATAALKDDRIATIYQIGAEGNALYLAMELLHGEALDTRLKRAPVTVPQAIWLVREAALGLAVAHQSGFVHRDIKPANLWLDNPIPDCNDPRQNGQISDQGPRAPHALARRVKLLDFGLVQLGRSNEGAGTVAGTPGYMAPEQALGQTGDARADLYALGVMLFEMVTGRLPFVGRSLEMLTAKTTQDAPAVRTFVPDLSPALADLIDRLLDRNPIKRPVSAAAVAEALERIGENLDKEIVAVGTKALGNRKAIFAVGTVVCVLAAVGVGAFLYKPTAAAPEPEVPVIQPAPPIAAVLTPEQTHERISETVTVEFVVKAASPGPSGGGFLLFAGGGTGFRIVISPNLAYELKRRGFAETQTFAGGIIRVTGQVIRNGSGTEILVNDLKQIDKLLPKSSSETSSKSNGKSPAAIAPASPTATAPNQRKASDDPEGLVGALKSFTGGKINDLKVLKPGQVLKK
jgi:hypothetical protein